METKNITQKELSDFVNNEVYINQSMLIYLLLEKNIFSYEDIENFCKTDKELEYSGYNKENIKEIRDRGEDNKEIFEWWLVSDFLLEKLSNKKEPILRTDYGNWWGRTCTGQAIYLDGIIEDIYKDFK